MHPSSIEWACVHVRFTKQFTIDIFALIENRTLYDCGLQTTVNANYAEFDIRQRFNII